MLRVGTFPRSLRLAIAAMALAGCKDREAMAGADGGRDGGTGTADAGVDAGPPVPGSITFGKVVPQVGEVTVDTRVGTIRLDMRGNAFRRPINMHVDRTQSTRSTERVLAVTRNAVTKLEIRTEESKLVDRSVPPSADPHAAWVGKTYVLTAEDEKMIITRDGTVVSPAEAAPLQRAYPMFGKPDPFAAVLPARPIAPGERVPGLGAAVAEDILRWEEGLRLVDSRVTFRERRADEGLFDVALTLDQRGDVTVDLRGELTLGVADGRLRRLTLAGDVAGQTSADAGRGRASLASAGHLEVTVARTR